MAFLANVLLLISTAQE